MSRKKYILSLQEETCLNRKRKKLFFLATIYKMLKKTQTGFTRLLFCAVINFVKFSFLAALVEEEFYKTKPKNKKERNT